MKYYPVFLNINEKDCLVVGGGNVGYRKVETLLKYGAEVTVVSPEVLEPLEKLSEKGHIKWLSRIYRTSDIDGRFMVICATDRSSLNRQVSCDAGRKGILCNIADNPEDSSFILPAVVSRGDLSIAVSTSGKSPALAKQVRKELEISYGEEYKTFLDLMGNIREELLKKEHDPDAHKRIFSKLVQSDLRRLIRDKKHRQADEVLRNILGRDFPTSHVWPETK